MWIMLIKKLPTAVSPPKMSLFWSEPWINKEYSKKQEVRIKLDHMWRGGSGELYDDVDPFCGKEPDWGNAVKIRYLGEHIRVFPHEFTVPSPKNLMGYVEESHELVADNVAEEEILHQVFRGGRKDVFEAALLDGCNKLQAKFMALGVDIMEEGGYDVPPMGWYKIKREYGEPFCTENDLEETDRRVTETGVKE